MVAVAIAVTSIACLPPMLVGGLAVLLQDELDFGKAQLGSAIAIYYMCGALSVMPANLLAGRQGSRMTAWLGLAGTVLSLLGCGLFAGSWASLAAFLVVGGCGNAFALVGVNELLAKSVMIQRHGLAFGLAQAAPPLAALVAGLSLPVIGLTLGWRWVFTIAAATVPLAAVSLPSGNASAFRDRYFRGTDARVGTLVLLAIGMALAVAGGNAAATFTVTSSVARGIAPADAGLTLAAGGGVVVLVRIGAGWLADRLGTGSLLLAATLLAATLLAVGLTGYVGLAASNQHPAATLGFTLLAFGGGWGCSGLVLLAASRSSPSAPGGALSVVLVGLMAGSVFGPLAFGAAAEVVGLSAAWLLMAGMTAAGACAILLSRRRILRDRHRTADA